MGEGMREKNTNRSLVAAVDLIELCVQRFETKKKEKQKENEERKMLACCIDISEPAQSRLPALTQELTEKSINYEYKEMKKKIGEEITCSHFLNRVFFFFLSLGIASAMTPPQCML